VSGVLHGMVDNEGKGELNEKSFKDYSRIV